MSTIILFPVSRTTRAGIVFPVGRFHRYLRQGNYADRIGSAAPVYMAAVLEYLVAEIIELSGNCSYDQKKTRINPRHITLAIRNDSELAELLNDVIISEGGVLPHIEPILLPANSRKNKGPKADQNT